MRNYSALNLISQMLQKSRADAGVSQEALAGKLGVSRRTIQNWEAGASSPTLDQGLAWFEALHLQPLPYFLNLLYKSSETSQVSSDELDRMLLHFVQGLPRRSKEQLVYLAYGDHGTAPMGFIELETAYLQTSLRDRMIAAQLIVSNYEMSRSFNQVNAPEQVQPDVTAIKSFIEDAKATIQDRLSRR